MAQALPFEAWTGLSPERMPSPYLGLGTEAQLRAVADHLPDGLFTTDLEGRVTSWNAAAERITGWTRAEALGRDCSVMAGDTVNGCACGIGPLRCGLAATGRKAKCCTVRTRGGELLLIVKSAVPLYGEDGEVVGALETFTDAGAAAGFEARIAEAARKAGCEGDCCDLVGTSAPMRELYRLIGLVSRSDATVMILGESGTGKERVAEAIHRLSDRSPGPFVRVSCAALNENLLESELFGHVKGAFTGALRDRRGRFEEATGGTLLLDEIGDISPLVQLKLLRVIEQREVERVGDSTPIPVDVRLLCATHRDLKGMVAEGRFRADLYFRLAVFPLRVPALREHVEDLPVLVSRFLERAGASCRLGPGALEALRAYPWPGNVRELQNALEFAGLQARGGTIEPCHLPLDVAAAERGGRGRAGTVGAGAGEQPRRGAGPRMSHPGPGPAGAELRDVGGLRRVLDAHGWNRAAAARTLGISRVTLWKRLKLLGLDGPR